MGTVPRCMAEAVDNKWPKISGKSKNSSKSDYLKVLRNYTGRGER